MPRGAARLGAFFVSAMWEQIAIALCLMLVFEGVMPFLSPQNFKKSLLMALQFSDNTLRYLGLAAMLIGAIGVYFLT